MHAPSYRLAFSWLVLAGTAVLALPAGAGDRLPRIRLPAVFKYVDAPSEEEAAERLPALLKKYATPRSCRDLLKALSKRPYPSRMPDRQTREHLCSDGKTREFTWILPSRYSKRKPTGVLVFLHGAVRQPAPGGGANEAGMFAPAVKELGLIVIGPSTYDGVGWDDPACRDLVHHAVDFAKRWFNVDENRVYLAGDSDGGRGTYAIVETEASFVAAAVPVIGAPGGVTRFLNLRGVPFFAINGDRDSIFDIESVRRMVAGMKNSGIDLRYKEIAGGGHEPRFFLTHREEICAFLEAHPRDPFPTTVRWQLDPARKDHGGGFPTDTFRWIRIAETGSSTSRGTFEDMPGGLIRSDFPRVEATYAGNVVEVTTRGVTRYEILVAPAMLDLDADVEVRTNGHLSFRGRVEPEARVILEEARRFRDRHLRFVNRLSIEVDAVLEPPPEETDAADDGAE